MTTFVLLDYNSFRKLREPQAHEMILENWKTGSTKIMFLLVALLGTYLTMLDEQYCIFADYITGELTLRH